MKEGSITEGVESQTTIILWYLRAWFWHILAIMFLNSLIILVTFSQFFYVYVLAALVLLCEGMAWYIQTQHPFKEKSEESLEDYGDFDDGDDEEPEDDGKPNRKGVIQVEA